jgi:hypothetical protein
MLFLVGGDRKMGFDQGFERTTGFETRDPHLGKVQLGCQWQATGRVGVATPRWSCRACAPVHGNEAVMTCQITTNRMAVLSVIVGCAAPS